MFKLQYPKRNYKLTLDVALNLTNYFYINGEEKDSYRPEGIYLRTYCIGSWEQLPEIYQILLDYCKAQHLEPIGYAYEEGLNELAVPSEDTYVTQILVRVVPQD